MRHIFKFKIKLLSTEEQQENHCNLTSPLHIAIYKPIADTLELKKHALLLSKNAIVNVEISTLNLPVKLGTYRSCLIHEDLKAFFKDDEEVLIINFDDLAIFDKFKVIKPNRIYRTVLMETISAKFPRNLQRWCIPGQIYYGINRKNDQIWKFELIGFSNKFEISKNREDVGLITYFVAADKLYDAIEMLSEKGKLKEPEGVIDKISEGEIVLKDKFSKKILQFYNKKGAMPSHMDLVSDKIGIPLGYEKQVLQYLFGPILLNLPAISDDQQRVLERNGKRILFYVAKKRRQAKSDMEIWQPMISEIIFELNLKVHDLRLAFEYLNIPYKDFIIKPDEVAKIDRLSKIIINMAQKNKKIPTLSEVVNKGMSIAQAKKAFKISDEILRNTFPLWENELKIPHLLFPVDEMVSEHLDKSKEMEVIIPQKKEPSSEDSYEIQITKAKFNRNMEEPINFTGNPEIFLKRARNIVESELTVLKIKENIISESDIYSGDIIYAFLNKKKQVHFSIQIGVDGNLIDESGKAELIIKSNELPVAERFFNIFKNRLEELAAELTKDHFLSDSQDILQIVKSFGKGKNWTNVEELTIRLNYSPERAQRILDYMEQNNMAKKTERASTGTRYYFPGLT